MGYRKSDLANGGVGTSKNLVKISEGLNRKGEQSTFVGAYESYVAESLRHGIKPLDRARYEMWSQFFRSEGSLVMFLAAVDQ